MAELQHPIKIVAKRTGLTPHVIRIWEKRYCAVTPCRTTTNRRLYSECEIERLSLLRQATAAGHSISHVAKLATDELRTLLAGRRGQEPQSGTDVDALKVTPEGFLEECLRHIARLDAKTLEDVLGQAAVHLGSNRLLNELIVPLTRRMGELWEAGTLRVAQEHFASSVIRGFLAASYRPFATPDTAPVIVVATPVGQLHELGAVMAAAAATNHGWRVTYLGCGLPAVEIAGAAIQNQARAVALSIVYPQDDPHLPPELANLRRFLPQEIKIIVGGRAAAAYREPLDSLGAIRVESLTGLCDLLQGLREPSRG